MADREWFRKRVSNHAWSLYDRADRKTGGVLGLLKDAFDCFRAVHPTQAAASIAYYALFSLFPLLIVLVSASGSILKSQSVQQQVLDYVTNAMPVSQRLIERNVEHVLRLRGPVGILGLASLLWSATGVFTALVHNINRAWPEAETRNFVQNRLLALAIVGLLTALLILSLVTNTALDVLPKFSLSLANGVHIDERSLWTFFLNISPWAFAFSIFLVLYRLVPGTDVRWREAFWGAFLTALGWFLVTRGFTWYVSSGMVQYQLVYGSLWTIVALMFWIYIGSLITLFGAHLSAAVARWDRRER